MTKKQIRQSVNEFLANSEHCKVESERRKHAALLNKLCDNYQEELSLADNIRIRINSDSKKTFDGFKTRVRHWVKFSNLENEVDLNQIKFEFSYFTFIDLYDKTMKKFSDNWTKIDLYYFTMAKLYSYLRWIGVPPEKMFNLTKGDYNIDMKLLLVGDVEYDLKNHIYEECAEVIHKELTDNIYSLGLAKNVDTNVVEYIYGMKDVEYDEYKFLFSTISESSQCGKHLHTNIQAVLQDLIYPDILIAKNGLFDRVSKVTGNELISSVEFQEIIARPEISNTFKFSNELLQEYRSWQTKVK